MINVFARFTYNPEETKITRLPNRIDWEEALFSLNFEIKINAGRTDRPVDDRRTD